MKTPGLPEVMKHELCGLTVASMLGNFFQNFPKSLFCSFQGNGSPRPQRLICWESWLRLLPTMTPPHVRPEPSRYRWWWWLMWWLCWCWYTGSWHTVDTQLIHSWYTVDTQAVDWYVVPLVNPDGYEYSHTNDRLWRKNRSLKRILTAFYNLNYIFHNMLIEIYSLYRIAEHFPQGASTIKVPLPLSPETSPLLLWSWSKQVDRETETFMFMSSFTGHG